MRRFVRISFYYKHNQMKKTISLFCFVLVAVLGFSQTDTTFVEGRYRISFTDKKNSPYSIDRPQEFLSQRAIDRRTQFNIPITEQDIPVNPQYLSVVSDFGAVLCNSSKWFNSAIFFIETALSYNEIAKLSFVDKVEYVAPAIVYKKDGRKLVQQDTITSTPLQIVETSNKSDELKATVNDLVNLYGRSCMQNVQLGTFMSHIEGHLGQNQLIAVIDAGFLHVDSAAVFQHLWNDNRILFARDVTGTEKFFDTTSIFQTGGHGMMVLSLIGGFYPQKLVGTAPMANFILIRSEEEETEYIVEEDNWVTAAELADSAGANIISTSLGYSNFDDKKQSHTYAQMDGNTARITIGADIASAKGMLLVNSAGNSGDEPWKYITSPADADSVLTVGACKYNGKKTKFSSFGPTSDGRIKPDVMALGLFPTIVVANGEIKNASGGTSFSCPLVAGCCATLWEEFPDSSAQAIKRLMMRSGDRYDKPNNKYGHGAPNVTKARCYCYGKVLYDFLATKYTLSDYDTFFNQVWENGKSIFLSEKYVFEVNTGLSENPSFIVKDNDFSNIDLPEIAEKGGKLVFYVSYKKTFAIKIQPKK